MISDAGFIKRLPSQLASPIRCGLLKNCYRFGCPCPVADFFNTLRENCPCAPRARAADALGEAYEAFNLLGLKEEYVNPNGKEFNGAPS